MALTAVEATKAEELDVAFASAAAQRADAMIVFADALTIFEAPRVIALAAKHHLPAIYLFRQFAKGGLVVYGPDLTDLYRRAGGYVDKILKGTKPSDLPVEQPTKSELVINMKTAKALGLTVLPSLLARARGDRIVLLTAALGVTARPQLAKADTAFQGASVGQPTEPCLAPFLLALPAHRRVRRVLRLEPRLRRPDTAHPFASTRCLPAPCDRRVRTRSDRHPPMFSEPDGGAWPCGSVCRSAACALIIGRS